MKYEESIRLLRSLAVSKEDQLKIDLLVDDLISSRQFERYLFIAMGIMAIGVIGWIFGRI